MKYIAFDIGEARIGLAVTDELGMICRPLFAVPVSEGLFTRIGQVIDLEKPQVAIFGIPRHQNGEEAMVAEQIREFAKGVKHEYNIEIDFEDESGTTIEATRRLREAGKSEKEIKGLVDAESACVILESYLART